MSKGFKHGAGGNAALNFKVVGGTEQPANPKENTIWVNTETDISGWVFSPEEPETSAEGMVWIEVGSTSPAPFNALRKNGVYVYPVSCKQYSSGAWNDVFAYICQGGVWVQFSEIVTDVYLYNQGDMCTDVTGGWQARALNLNSESISVGAAPTVTINTSTILLKATYKSSKYSGGVYEVMSDIDLSNYNSIEVVVSSVSNLKNGGFGINVFDRSINSWDDGANAEARAYISGTGTAILDISSISGKWDIGIHTYNANNSAAPTIEFSSVVLK